jgi:lambda family phage tail tape measure protein
MADIDVTLAIDEKPALKALKNIQDSVKNTERSFGALGAVISGLAIGEFIKDTYDYARANQNLGSAGYNAVAAQDNMVIALDKFRIALLTMLNPLNSFIAGIDTTSEKFNNLVANSSAFLKVIGLIFTAVLIARINAVRAALTPLVKLLSPEAAREFARALVGANITAAITLFIRARNQILDSMEQKRVGAFRSENMNLDWEQQQADVLANMERMRETDIGNIKHQNTQLLQQLKIQEQIIGIEEKHIPFIQARGQLLQQRDNILQDLRNRIQNMSAEQTAAGGQKVLEEQMQDVTDLFERQSTLVSLQLRKIQDREIEAARRKKLFELGEQQAAAYEEERRAIEEFIDTKNREIEARNRSREAMTGWVESWKQFKDDATNAAQMVRDQFNSVFSNIDNALDNFVRTGKLSFKDLITSISRDLASLGLRNAFRQMVGAGFDLFGQHFSGAFAGGFANGGYIPAGKFGVVGERGPEFISGPAQITPMNGGGTVINNYISAMDAKSVAQLFAENRKTLLGVTEQAKKELNYKGMR